MIVGHLGHWEGDLIIGNRWHLSGSDPGRAHHPVRGGWSALVDHPLRVWLIVGHLGHRGGVA